MCALHTKSSDKPQQMIKNAGRFYDVGTYLTVLILAHPLVDENNVALPSVIQALIPSRKSRVANAIRQI